MHTVLMKPLHLDDRMSFLSEVHYSNQAASGFGTETLNFAGLLKVTRGIKASIIFAPYIFFCSFLRSFISPWTDPIGEQVIKNK